jgi:hypothetical protein
LVLILFKKKLSRSWPIFLFFLYQSAQALTPMWGYISLVAGESSAGHQDGSFFNATFDHPWGLAIDAAGNKLYVSDKDNNCIRVVDLERQNKVSTLAGIDQAGYEDGPFNRAAFHSPTSLVFLSPTLLAVNDAGNHRIRVLDLANQSVTTLAGNGTDGMQEGLPLQCALGTIWSMAYQPSKNSLFFSEPAQAGVQKLDLKANRISTVLQHRLEIPTPEALCFWKDQIYIADRNLTEVYQLAEQSLGPALLNPAGAGQEILALSGSDKGLYALQTDPTQPLKEIAPEAGPVDLISPWGEPLPSADNNPPCFDGLKTENNIQFVPDPASRGRFYVSNPQWQCLFSFRDLFPGNFIATEPNDPFPTGLTDWDYPAEKPSRTFRILMVGDSHVFHTFPDDYKKRGRTRYNLMESLTKKLEFQLNTLAALEDNPVHFEVLNQAMPATTPLFLWPYYLTPPVVQKYDVDLVLYMFSPNMFTPAQFNGSTNNNTDFSFQSYFIRPLTDEGIPARDLDPEVQMKPLADKIPSGLAGDFFKLCQKKGLGKVDGKYLWFADFNQLMAEPEVERDLIQLIGKPIRMLHDKISAARTSNGGKVGFYLGILPAGQFFPMKAQHIFWKDLRDYTGAPLLDLTDDFTALRPSWFPLSDHQEYDHFSADGYSVEALVLAHELIRQNLIPWPPADKVK